MDIDMEGFTLIAHRGASEDAPENTMEAFDLAIQQGFHHIETDCQLSADGVCVIIHDEMLDRLTAKAASGWRRPPHDIRHFEGEPFSIICVSDNCS